MKPKYIMKEVSIGSECDGLEFAVGEGDIILDKGFRFKVLPAAADFTKPITRRKASAALLRQSERLLRIKELGGDSASVAVLYQETSYETSDTLLITETEKLVTVKYGEKFSVYAKEQAFDSPFPTVYEFVIEDESEKQRTHRFCTECGERLAEGDKFCRECGTPAE